jgi:TrmH family RNA methyltransferase
LVAAALSAGVCPEIVLYAPSLFRSARGADLLRSVRQRGAPAHPVSEEALALVSTMETPPGILAVVAAPGTALGEALAHARPFLLALDGIQDPGNLGTMLRTAAAAGVTGALLGRGTVEPGNPKALRAAMGATFQVPLAVEVDLPAVLSELARRGVKVVAGDLEGETVLFGAALAPPLAVVVGGEANGLSPAVEAVVTCRLRIPMAAGVESLNAAAAAALLLYEVARRNPPEG